jgi:hypothetical protein
VEEKKGLTGSPQEGCGQFAPDAPHERCGKPIAVSYVWPGRDRVRVCREHAETARRVADAMGFALELTLLEFSEPTTRGEGRATDFAIDWSKYPKLARVFEHRPEINVYWHDLRGLLREARADAVRFIKDMSADQLGQACHGERAAIVRWLRRDPEARIAQAYATSIEAGEHLTGEG